jgi:GAF domain-containing protein
LRSPSETLADVIDQLSTCQDLVQIMALVRRSARNIMQADGATFVLRDGEEVFYADEDAIGPLWKGKRFPVTACISGWSMLHGCPVVIPDVYHDERIPLDAYRPTFVKSLIMVPIRRPAPVAAIGTYWAMRRWPAQEEVELLLHLADATALAWRNVPTTAQTVRPVTPQEISLDLSGS